MRAKLSCYANFAHTHAPAIGAGLVVLLVVISVMLGSHSFLAIFNIEGLLIVVGGVIAAAYMSYNTEDVKTALNTIRNLFKKTQSQQIDLSRDMMAIIYCARLLREKGMRSLETVISKSGLTDPFVKYGLNMAVSEYPAQDVRDMMETAVEATYERDSLPVDVLQSMASHAPAFGMVGTLVGMVILLSNFNGDMSSVGSSLGVAFLSTLYGVLSARMVYMPAASKLRQEVDHRRFRNYLITEGIVMLASEKTPMYIQDRLNSFLRPDAHNYLNVLNQSEPDHSSLRVAQFA
ncbi:MAG: MotA/TolQ/ExbB proton channel family protein [Alphaproteobacteria bacterium]|nr:MotA/TolQ/ExbB proton channel family protein [Alphaproteobacteria bacterium]